MKRSGEIRSEAWRLMWKGGWFGRGLVAAILLGVVLAAVSVALTFGFHVLNIETLRDFAAAQQKAAAEGLLYSASSGEALMRMTFASLFESFVQYLVGGIMMFGLTALTLMAVRGEGKGWFGRALSGFSMPFGMFWLMFNVQIRVGFWILLAVIPLSIVLGTVVQLIGVSAQLQPFVLGGLVAVPISLVIFWLVYRYYLVWLLKADHPEWSAGRCIRDSVALMNGRKWTAVRLDCSYWLCLLGFLPLAAALLWLVAKIAAVGGLDALETWGFALFAAVAFAAIAYGFAVGLYVAIGHAVFYRELTTEKQEENPCET